MHCNSCEMLAINGRACHEVGCPDAWRTEIRNCKWCGQDFVPDDSYQICCEDSCSEAYTT